MQLSPTRFAPMWGAWFTLTLTISVVVASPSAAADAPKLLFLKLQSSSNVGAVTHSSAEDAVEGQLNQAAPDRGWTLATLRRVSGLEAQARACRVVKCRQEIAGRLKATHILHGNVRKVGWKTYVDLILEDSKGKIIRAKTVEGRALSIAEKVRVGVDQLLEETSPKEATARTRLIATADSYAKARRAKDEVRTLSRAIQLNPFHADAAPLQGRIIDVWARSGEFDKAKDAAERLVDMYGPLSAWAKTAPKDAVERAQRAGRRGAIVTGTEAHRRARLLAAKEPPSKEDVKEIAKLRAVAAQSYTWIRRNWSRSKETPEATMYLADLRFDEGKYLESADLYVEAQADVTRKEAASIALVFALEQQLTLSHPNLSPDKDLPKFLPKKAQPIPAIAARYQRAVDALQTNAPNAPTRSAHEVSVAKLYLTLGHIDDGKKRLQAVTVRSPRSKAGKVASLVLKDLNKARSGSTP